MSERLTVVKEVRALCHGLLENALNDNQVARLDALVANDPSARKVYIELMNLHNTLMRNSASAVLRDCKDDEAKEIGAGGAGSFFNDHASLDLLPTFLDDEQEQASTDKTTTDLADNKTVVGIISQALPTAMKDMLSSSSFFAGTMTFSIGLFALLIYMLIPSSTQTPSNFARISQTVDAIWMNDTGQGNLEQLCIGRQLELESGLVQVEYTNGVRVNLEGPALFIVSGPNRGFLVHGKASALVKDVPTGFAIQTPIGKVTDLGTEFGVMVEDDQNTEVQVFDGLVKLDVSGGKQKSGNAVMPPQTLELRERKAVQIDAQRRVVEPVPYLPDQFARTYKNLRKYYFDGFSTDTSDQYVGTYSVWGEKVGNHGVANGQLVAEVETCSYSIFSREKLLGGNEVFAVTVPPAKPGLDVFVITTTAVGEPQGGPDGGIGFRLRREYEKGLVVQQSDSTQCSFDYKNPLVIDASRVKDPAPDEPLRLVIKRTGETEFTFYYEIEGICTKIYGPIVSEELADVERLYVGVEAFCRSGRKQSVIFDNLSVRPVRE